MIRRMENTTAEEKTEGEKDHFAIELQGNQVTDKEEFRNRLQAKNGS